PQRRRAQRRKRRQRRRRPRARRQSTHSRANLGTEGRTEEMAPRRSPKPRTGGKRPRQYSAGELPTREAVLEAMANEPQHDGKRDLARHFGIKGDMRTPFKVLLREMEADGLLARRRKSIRRTSTLPAVTVLD